MIAPVTAASATTTSEVACALCCFTLSKITWSGTRIIPPPTPNSPEVNPVIAPSVMSVPIGFFGSIMILMIGDLLEDLL